MLSLLVHVQSDPVAARIAKRVALVSHMRGATLGSLSSSVALLFVVGDGLTQQCVCYRVLEGALAGDKYEGVTLG